MFAAHGIEQMLYDCEVMADGKVMAQHRHRAQNVIYFYTRHDIDMVTARCCLACAAKVLVLNANIVQIWHRGFDSQLNGINDDS